MYFSKHAFMWPADDRTVLMNWNNPCEGYVGIIHDGQLGYVGSTNWNDAASKVVCSSIQCGNPVKSQRMTPPWPFDKFWINEVNCTGEEAQLWKCKFPGFGVSHHQKDSLRYIQCSRTARLSHFTLRPVMCSWKFFLFKKSWFMMYLDYLSFLL